MIAVVFLAFWLTAELCHGLCNNLALTPPMGWSSWERFRCNVNCRQYPRECISEWLIREMAYRMVTDGYLAAGYEYIIIDDCWLSKTRDKFGHLQPDRSRFPSGMRNLSDYVHSLGLKIGIYEDYGERTCEGYPGILPWSVERDADTFAYWGIDYVKVDGCYSDPLYMPEGFGYFGRWILHTGRPMVYACSWPTYQRDNGMSPNYTEAALMCNSFRNYRDIQDSWISVRLIMDYYAEHQDEFADYAGPGHWNDPDSLIIGNFGLSYEQAKVQMAIWAILAAPLIMSHDLRVTHPNFHEILLNPLLISINQDSMGIQGKRIYLCRRRGYEVWAKPVLPCYGAMTSWAIAILNLEDTGEPRVISFPLKYTELGPDLRIYSFVDLFEVHRCVRISRRGSLVTRIPPLGVKIFKVTLTLAVQ